MFLSYLLIRIFLVSCLRMFVIVIGGEQVSTLSKKERNMDGAAKAKFNFTAQTPMEVSFLKGKNILNVRMVSYSVPQANLLF